MNIAHIRDLALKILGIFYLCQALVYAPQICGIFTSLSGNCEYQASRLAVGLSVFLPLFFWLVAGAILTFRTAAVIRVLWSRRESDESMPQTAGSSMTTWIMLVGVFYFVGSLGGVVAELWRVVERRYLDPIAWDRFVPNLITLGLSIACVVKARAIETWLRRRIGKDSSEGSGGGAGNDGAGAGGAVPPAPQG